MGPPEPPQRQILAACGSGFKDSVKFVENSKKLHGSKITSLKDSLQKANEKENKGVELQEQSESQIIRASGSPAGNAVSSNDVSILTWSRRQCSSTCVSVKHNQVI
ncbi:hypothetical protein E5288_WYG003792 [Bos mutus]|uniref:Uncharacterized protein n=1 Tax=Bos mutus TaxID=72004 RepID=A0A6B0RI12_9CETA|nr:hypothetical protein [Bos mutus]